jgi:hypothetical protein
MRNIKGAAEWPQLYPIPAFVLDRLEHDDLQSNRKKIETNEASTWARDGIDQCLALPAFDWPCGPT